MKTKQPQVTKTDIRKALVESAFNPREAGPLRIVAEVGSVSYYTTRAIELVREGQVAFDNHELGALSNMLTKIEQAISLLALAKANLKKPVNVQKVR